jgi:hypothetical protein
MKKTITILSLAVLAIIPACTNSNYEIYLDPNAGYLQAKPKPDIYVVVNKEKTVYYRIINIHTDGTINMGNAPTLQVEKGYHVGDRESYGGYDLTRTYGSLDDAIKAATSAADANAFGMGEAYQFQGKELYNTYTFTKLEKQ